ncbi:YncE family protein [Streptomyces sp. NPDC059063]|uniref:YncE family protein n=1 Tax=unclassified Streptomyces TaxID=2593676 RepID=UPI0036776646
MTLPEPAGAQLAVLSHSGRALHFLDLASGHRTGLLGMLPEAHELCFDPDRRLLYASHTYRSGHYLEHGDEGHEITVVDVDARKVVDVVDLAPEHAPHGLKLDRAAGVLYISVEEGPAGPGGLVALDTATRLVKRRFSAEAPVPHWMAVTPDGRRAYTANKCSSYVSVVDLVRGGPVRPVPVGGSEGLDVSPDGSRVYVATPALALPPDPDADYAVQVVDARTQTVTHTLRTSHAPSPVHVTHDGKLLVGQWRTAPEGRGVRFEAGLLSVYDASSLALLGEAEVARSPINIVSTPDGSTAFVTGLHAQEVSVVDLAAYRVTGTLDLDLGEEAPGGGVTHQGAHGLAYIPAPAA